MAHQVRQDGSMSKTSCHKDYPGKILRANNGEVSPGPHECWVWHGLSGGQNDRVLAPGTGLAGVSVEGCYGVRPVCVTIYTPQECPLPNELE